MNTQVVKILEIAENLKFIDREINNFYMSAILRDLLTHSYNTLITVLKATPEAKFVSDFIRNKLDFKYNCGLKSSIIEILLKL